MNVDAKEAKEPSLAFGGQAVMEGVMMRSKNHMVICVRQPNNQIATKREVLHSLSERYSFLKLPFIRGILALIETLYSGIKGIYFSANAAFGEDENEEEILSPVEIAVVIVVAIGLSILLFSVTPFVLTSLFDFGGGLLFNVVEGALRLSFLLVYLVIISLVGDFKRIFQYHGAEHTAINAYEAGVELNVENARKYSRFHSRCGTSFLFIVTLISILVFYLLPRGDFLVSLSYRVVFVPVISAISYELLKLSDKYRDSAIMKVLVAPGVALQHLTTRPPDDDMLEVAIKAVKEVESMKKASD
ncbi:MAG: DUF1385 domain-containing protein [Candidatus Bathyarchaeum sp.]|nr:MAG: DUF1385 domain-containing protein [Candidatus Bathyarchaeum sp.]